MNTPFYCQRSFWVSAAGNISALAALCAANAKLHGLYLALAAVATICGNLGSVIAERSAKGTTNG
jgi:hypothetical protein